MGETDMELEVTPVGVEPNTSHLKGGRSEPLNYGAHVIIYYRLAAILSVSSSHYRSCPISECIRSNE